tara:strand:+ start:262 stop:483 length:222 start_codon:yes stop_codon:yes gene_type:complete
MANLQQIAFKYRVSENFLNSKEDALLIVQSSCNDLISELNLGSIDESRKQSIITKLEKLSSFCGEVKNSSFSG